VSFKLTSLCCECLPVARNDHNHEFSCILIATYPVRPYGLDYLLHSLNYSLYHVASYTASSRFFVFSKGHLDECLAIANAKGRYGHGRVGKKARPCLLPFPYRLKHLASYPLRKTDFQQSSGKSKFSFLLDYYKLNNVLLFKIMKIWYFLQLLLC